MSDNDTIEAAETAAEKPAKTKSKAKAKAKSDVKAKTKAKTKAKGPKREKAAKAPPEFDFVGKVESLHLTSGGGAEAFRFGLKGRHGKRQLFRFDAADGFAANAMVQLVLAAHASAAKIGLRTGAEVDGVLIVRELESRPKFGKTG